MVAPSHPTCTQTKAITHHPRSPPSRPALHHLHCDLPHLNSSRRGRTGTQSVSTNADLLVCAHKSVGTQTNARTYTHNVSASPQNWFSMWTMSKQATTQSLSASGLPYFSMRYNVTARASTQRWSAALTQHQLLWTCPASRQFRWLHLLL